MKRTMTNTNRRPDRHKHSTCKKTDRSGRNKINLGKERMHDTEYNIIKMIIIMKKLI